MKKHRPFFVQRQRLAERLAMAGIEVLPCQNIYDSTQRAWKCALTKQAAEVIQADYEENGKPVPEIVLDALAQ